MRGGGGGGGGEEWCRWMSGEIGSCVGKGVDEILWEEED